jgi:hypothetical protein
MAATTVSARAISQYSGDGVSDLFIRDVSKFPKLIKRTDYPLTSMIKPGSPLETPKLKLEWTVQYLDPVTDTVTEAIADEAGPSTITPANIGYYMVGQVIEMASGEQGLITAVGATTFTMTRSFAGTTRAAQADNSGIRIIGLAIKENQESPLGPITLGEVDYNYFQIYDLYVQFSARARYTPIYGQMDDRLTFEVEKKLRTTMPQLLENTLLRGVRSIGSTTVPSSMGGVFTSSFNQNQVAMSSAILTEYDFLEAVQKGFNNVGREMSGKTVMAHPFYKRVFANWTNNMRQYSPGDKKVNNVFDTFETDFGTFEFVHNHHMVSVNDPTLPDGRILIFDRDDYTLRPYHKEARWGVWAVYEGGWYSRRAIRGDYTLEAINPEKRVIITGISTTAAEYPNFTS